MEAPDSEDTIRISTRIERGIRFDAVDERGAARLLREQALDGNDVWTTGDDRLECRRRFGVGKRLGVGILGAGLQDVQLIRFGDENYGHRCPEYRRGRAVSSPEGVGACSSCRAVQPRALDAPYRRTTRRGSASLGQTPEDRMTDFVVVGPLGKATRHTSLGST